ncbi:LemA family protein [Crocinitomix algicola]|uniref:LemA family protein n=1 Tax=Crocinitomix algicola TaxID=1740263 RepID=UPI000829D156|nr:LemA family protein [Crocinitomix algicola]
MEEHYSEEKFKQHIRTVVQKAEGNSMDERPLTLSELKELAISMGMSEGEWDELQKKAIVHLATAEKHLKARNFEDAIAAAELATSINPYLKNSNSILAKSYQMLSLEDKDTQALQKAEYYARKELLTDPNDQVAINVLSAINKSKKNAGAASTSRKKIIMIASAIIGLMLIGYFAMSTKASGQSSSQLENDLIVAEENMFSKFDLVQTAINQRNNMLPDLFAAAGGQHQDLSELNNEIASLRKKANQLTGEKRFELEGKIDKKVADAKQLVKTYSDGKDVATLLVQIEGAENRIAFEKKAYNDAVKEYNILVKKSKGEYPNYEIQPYFNAE